MPTSDVAFSSDSVFPFVILKDTSIEDGAVVGIRSIVKGKVKENIVVAGSQWGKIRAIVNDKGEVLNNLSPSEPAEILGLNDVPQAGDDIIVVENESRAREVSEYRQGLKQKEKTTILSRANSMETILKNIFQT